MTDVHPLRLDASTLLFAVSLLGFAMAAIAASSARRSSVGSDGLVEWAKAMGAVGGAFLLFFLHGHASPVWTYLCANGVVLAVPAYGLLAHAAFFQAPAPRRSIATACAFGISGVVAVHFFEAPIGTAVFTMSVAIAVMFAVTGHLILRHAGAARATSSRVAASTMFVLAIICVIRAVAGATGAGEGVSLMTDSGSTAITLVLTMLLVISASTALFLMVGNRQRRQEMERFRQDVLTGLLTRAAFFESLSGIHVEAHEAYSLVVIDLDHFKVINDTYGHSSGDVVLTFMGRLILRSIRSFDLAGRYGGEEFCVVLRKAGQQEARAFTERLVADTRQQTVRLANGSNVHVTISAGYATRNPESRPGVALELLAQVFERADLALYEAKRSGRDKAVAAKDGPPRVSGFHVGAGLPTVPSIL
ncbi:GGDEF domain-containing protein [soil metagenome]